MIGRLGRNELHRTTGGIAPEQRALRATQGFNAGKVEHRKARRRDRRGVAVVLIDRDRRFLLIAIVVLRHAANVVDDLRTAIGIELQVRHRAHDIGGVGDVHRLDFGSADHADRDADIVGLLFAALGGDHDLARRDGILGLGIGTLGLSPGAAADQRESDGHARRSGGERAIFPRELFH